MLHIIQLIQINNDKESKKGAKVLALSNQIPFNKHFAFRSFTTYYDLFSITKDDKEVMNSYRKTPDKFINVNFITINKKRRKIIEKRDLFPFFFALLVGSSAEIIRQFCRPKVVDR
jgi:hypothetical protein